MRPKIIAVGAFLLVLGAALIAVTPVLTEAALYGEEISLSTSAANGLNATSLLISERNTLVQYELLAVVGVAVAAAGAGILGYGLSTGETREPEKSVDSAAATPSPSGGIVGMSA